MVSAHTDLHLGLDPRPDDIGLVGKLSAQTLVVLLPGVLFNQSLVALRHQLPDLQQPGDWWKHPSALILSRVAIIKMGTTQPVMNGETLFPPPFFFFFKDLLSALHSFHNTSSYSLTEYKNKSLMPLKLTKAWICFDWSCHTHFTLL